MINSHYVPQFILRNFYNNGKITYCDLEKKTIQLRNSKSVFSEEGYYPEGIERSLAENIEVQFAGLFHNKIENARGNLTFTANELFIIKKYLIVSTVRYKYDLSDEDKVREKLLGPAFKIDYDRCLNEILACERVEDAFEIISRTEKSIFGGDFGKETEYTPNMQLWAEMKDVLNSYLIFVKPKSDERFLIPDVGRGIYEGPLGLRKTTSIIEALQYDYDPYLERLLQLITPRDYTIFPLSRNLAVITVCSFYKLLTKSEFNVQVQLPEEYPTVSKLLEFGDSDIIRPPIVTVKNGTKEYKYEIKQLVSRDVCHLNSLMLAEAEKYIACADLNDIQRSIELAAEEYTDRDISFMLMK